MSGNPKRHAPRGPLIQRDPMVTPDPMAAKPRAMCAARSKQTGQPCQQRPAAGHPVCRFHGGNAPQVKQKAMDRLIALQDPAIDRLDKLIHQEEFPTVAYAASRDVLDRTMGKPGESLKVSMTLSLEELVAGSLRVAE